MKQRRAISGFLFCLLILTLLSCEHRGKENRLAAMTRRMVDTVGFAHEAWQMDSITDRIVRFQGDRLNSTFHNLPASSKDPWKVVISPHDDYSYVGYLYPATLSYLKAKTIIIFGVCHKAKQFGLKNILVFDSFEKWQSAYGLIDVSGLREKIINRLTQNDYVINDSMQAVEHSVEALLPFIQQHNQGLEIVSILVPYMSFERMDGLAKALAEVINTMTVKEKFEWGKDFAFAISSDAVHYGDEDWGGKNFAYYGADSAGYVKAVIHELEIIDNCLLGELAPDKIKRFSDYTVEEDDYMTYKWTWCGRYSIPFGLLTAYYLNDLQSDNKKLQPLVGVEIGYATSIDHEHLFVDDLQMGVTAPANIHHWVGYAGVGYK